MLPFFLTVVTPICCALIPFLCHCLNHWKCTCNELKLQSLPWHWLNFVKWIHVQSCTGKQIKPTSNQGTFSVFYLYRLFSSHFQFVPFRDYIDRSGNQVLSMARLAKDVLAEIPDQLLSFMKSRAIEPRPPLSAISDNPSVSNTTATTTKECKKQAWGWGQCANWVVSLRLCVCVPVCVAWFQVLVWSQWEQGKWYLTSWSWNESSISPYISKKFCLLSVIWFCMFAFIL